MYVVKKMQLNKFEPKPIVSNRQMFLSVGPKDATINSKETADCYNQPIPEGAKKTQLLGLAQDMSNAAYAKQQSDGQSSDLVPTNPRDL